MYDTTIMELHKGDAVGIDFIKDVSSKLMNLKEGVINGVNYCEGYLDGILKVRCTNQRLKIPEGNMRAFFFDNPFYDFDRGTYEKAIEKLEDELQVPIKRARMKRIDCGLTISLKHKPEIYFRHYGNIKGYKRLDQDNGVTWKSKEDSYVMYWKQNHLIAKKRPIPIDKKNRNHLRAELRVSRQLGKYFGHSDIRAEDLFNESFYMNAFDKWHCAYEKVMKSGRELNSISIPQTKSELLENLACVGVSKFHPSEVEDRIYDAQQMRNITPKQAHDLRKTVKRLQEKGRTESPSELVEELNRKILMRVQNCR